MNKYTHNQLSLLDLPVTPEQKPVPMTYAAPWKLYTDGASRNNPGPASVGIVLYHNNELHTQAGYYIGNKTNNQAEYLALVIGLWHVQQVINPEEKLHILCDSELLVKQVMGHYKIKNPELKQLHTVVLRLLSDYSYSIGHVLREHNTAADAQANKALDTKYAVPPHIQEFLKLHEIHLTSHNPR